MSETVTQPVWETTLPGSIDALIHGSIARVEPEGLRRLLERAVSGGKRMRPLLAALACEAAGGNERDTIVAGAALELLHSSSLVHDDIMDKAELRRGTPTIVHGEGVSIAVLAGDALLAIAFRLINSISAPRKQQIQDVFTSAFLHLCEGQYADVRPSELPAESSAAHVWMVERKTAKLVEACTTIGGLLATAHPMYLRALAAYGRSLGLAYQATDDLLDAIGTHEETGKTVGLDSRNGRRTYLTLAYPERDETAEIRTLVAHYIGEACKALDALPPSRSRDRLVDIALGLMDRRQ
ncbi:MAG: polyprenyl synthetase [Bacteroidetes bacterium]|nr:polyprenyl synthetase [Bacteroidota bacterium]